MLGNFFTTARRRSAYITRNWLKAINVACGVYVCYAHGAIWSAANDVIEYAIDDLQEAINIPLQVISWPQSRLIKLLCD